MADKENNKDPLERFFQKKADEYDISYREEDWLKLENKLNIKAMRQTYQQRIQWLVAASILIASLLGYFTYDNHNRITQMGQQLHEAVTPEAGRGLDSLIASEGTQHATEEESEDPGAQSQPAEPGQRSPTVYAFDARTPSIPDSRVVNITRQQEINRPERFLTDNKVQLITKREVPELSQVNEPSREVNYPTVAMEVRKDPQYAAVKVLPERQRLAAGFVIAPDLSTVGSLSNFYDPGYKIGVTLEYRLSENLSLATGAIQSQVRYRASYGDSNPITYWRDGIIPDETVGECLLIDIPVTLKYNFMNFTRSRLYATTGFSTYIMLNEEYQFNYNTDNSTLVQGWSGNTGTSHFMSNAGFSVGYELDVHPNWSLRAEPFIKVPLRDVGWANVRLFSVGSFVSFSYNFGK